MDFERIRISCAMLKLIFNLLITAIKKTFLDVMIFMMLSGNMFLILSIVIQAAKKN